MLFVITAKSREQNIFVSDMSTLKIKFVKNKKLMARIFITGSADGLGFLAAKALIQSGHEVVIHARNEARATHITAQLPQSAGVLVADLSNPDAIKALAMQANTLGQFDAVIHNAGIYKSNANYTGNLPELFVVNSMAPYLLTALMHPPKRLIYLSSDMHLQGNADMGHLIDKINNNNITYSDTKLHDLILSMAISRLWKQVYVNTVNPGWVPTKMGGQGAPDNLEKGYETQVWLAVSNNREACVSGQYFYHQKKAHYLQPANEIAIQEKFLTICKEITGIPFPYTNG